MESTEISTPTSGNVLEPEDALEAVNVLLGSVKPLVLGLGKEFIGAVECVHKHADPGEAEEPLTPMTQFAAAGVSVVLQKVALNTGMRNEDWQAASGALNRVENAIRVSWPEGLERMTSEEQLDVSMAVESFEEPTTAEDEVLTKALAHTMKYARSLKSTQERALALHSLSELLDSEDSLFFFLRKEATEAKPVPKDMPEHFGADSEMVDKPVGVEKKQNRRKLIAASIALLVVSIGAWFVIQREAEQAERTDWRLDLINFRTAQVEVRNEINGLLEGYHLGDTIEARIPFLKDGKRLQSAMNYYYEYVPKERGYEEIIDLREGTIAERDVVMGSARRDNGDVFGFFAVKEGEGYLLDWKAMVGWGTTPWSRFVISGSATPGQFRVMAQVEDFYGGPFSSSEKFVSIKMTDGQGKNECYGYAERNSVIGQRLMTTMHKAGSSTVPLMVQLDGKLVASSAFPQVQIMDVIQEEWFDPELIFGLMPTLPTVPDAPNLEPDVNQSPFDGLPEAPTDPSLLDSENPFGDIEI